jgi:endonuclease YncB( thermonuclease family)
MSKYLLAAAIVVFCLSTADAASLFGRVIDVNSGDVITISNLNRPVRVKLLGVDAPELDQAFGDVARKHLSDLIFDKGVLVEYAGIASDSSLTGRVLLNNVDIGAQMIRDGAAWFEPNGGSRLSESDRDVYQQSEQAARSEKRGLWQAENPTAPWEFVKAEALRKNPVARINGASPAAKRRGDGPVPEFTNLSLIAPAANRPAQVEPTIKDDFASAMSAGPKSWERFHPAGENFSVVVPSGGRLKTVQEPAGDEMVDVHSYLVRDGWASYALTWGTGPSLGETDKSALDIALQGVLKGLDSGYAKAGAPQAFSCGDIPEKSIMLNGYAGKEFDLSSCTLPGRVRAFTRGAGNQRSFYLAAVFYLQEDENVTRFLNSFTVGRK